MQRDSSTRRRWLTWLALGALALSATAPTAMAQAQAPPKAPPEKATEPVPRAGGQMKLHEEFLERAKKGDIDLLFLGDSITAGWKKTGKDVWDRFYGARNAVNFGIGGDRTQHVLWRIENGEIEGIKPKAVVLMIGTNNIGRNPTEEIVDGIKAIVRRLREKLPETKILLLAVFPRSEKPNPAREQITAVNEKIASLSDGKMITYLDISKPFLNDDGTISREIMPDFLHLSSKGYRIWADSMEPTLWTMLDGEKAKDGDSK